LKLRAIVHASELLTGTGVRAKDGRRIDEDDLGRIADGAMVYSIKKVGGRDVPHRIEWVGTTSTLPKKYARIKKQDLKGKRALVPGLIDCHTHLVFAGDRAAEFARRCAGETYEQIKASGGGIISTVRATRDASESELLRLAIPRVKESMSFGVRTLEIKSGYGLSVESELKILRVIRALRGKFPEVTIRSTFLGAHSYPGEMGREAYCDLVCDEMLPRVAREKLADTCDVFVDEGYFTVEAAQRILARAKELGMAAKVHADELSDTGSAAFAVGIGALSADHLLRISEAGVRALAASETTAVLLPGTAFFLNAAQAPGRKLIAAGARVALSTDFNPGTCTTLSLPLVMTIAALQIGLSRAEIFAATTYNAACALGLGRSKGTLEKGKDADFWVMPFDRFEGCYSRFGWTA